MGHQLPESLEIPSASTDAQPHFRRQSRISAAFGGWGGGGGGGAGGNASFEGIERKKMSRNRSNKKNVIINVSESIHSNGKSKASDDPSVIQ